MEREYRNKMSGMNAGSSSEVTQHPLELLSPARDLECGLAAINHGADAVYIGAPRFGARSAAGNSLQDIEALVRHAHIYSARIYIALNTLFTDREIDEAVLMARQLYEIGADALIIQDMGLLECELPPIPLHASTQADNRTPEKVRFLEQAGFQQVVLARELSLKQIREVRNATTLPLEFFIHGALCVSYSGRCYLSEKMAGRSANRGECAQFCRHRYTLKDSSGEVLEKDRYLLSMKDLNLSDHIGALVQAGISSFKIEGRLKDAGYVKNITAWYRQLLDRYIDDNPGLRRASSGRCSFGFSPDPAKSFNRGSTDYFLNTRRNTPASPDTPKSTGEPVGRVESAGADWFTLKTEATLHNGDGLCYFDAEGNLTGMNANRVEGRRVFHRNESSPTPGTEIFRNHDAEFAAQLQKSILCRFIGVDLMVEETSGGLACRVEDEDGLKSELAMDMPRDTARQPGMIVPVIEKQMRKSGGTVFRVDHVRVKVAENLFVRTSDLNELRRQALTGHLEERQRRYVQPVRKLEVNNHPWLSTRVTYSDNIANSRARDFYRRHGVTDFDFSEQGLDGEENPALMTTRYCVRAQLGLCPHMPGGPEGPAEPLILSDQSGEYRLDFDCAGCEMTLGLTMGR